MPTYCRITGCSNEATTTIKLRVPGPDVVPEFPPRPLRASELVEHEVPVCSACVRLLQPDISSYISTLSVNRTPVGMVLERGLRETVYACGCVAPHLDTEVPTPWCMLHGAWEGRRRATTDAVYRRLRVLGEHE